MSLASLGLPGRNLMPERPGYETQVIADNAPALTIGASLDWSLVVPTVADIVLDTTQVIRAGSRYLRYGQVMTRITGAGAYTVTPSGAFTLSVANSATGAAVTQTTVSIPAGSSASTVAQALWALNDVGYQNAVVTGGNGSPYLITFPNSSTVANVLGATTLTASGATVAAGTNGVNVKFFGPYDPAAQDGRQNLYRGDCFIVNRTRIAGGMYQRPLSDDQHLGECVTGGKVWGAKVIATNGTASLAAGPTWPALLAAMPTLYPHYV